jgi:hypothetical protein
LALTVLNVVLISVPIRMKEATAATAINAAINVYSIAVTPDSSLRTVRNEILLASTKAIVRRLRQKL